MYSWPYQIIPQDALVQHLEAETGSQTAFLIDRNVFELHHWLQNLLKRTGFPFLLLDANESEKNLATAQSIWHFCQQNHIDRKSSFQIVGGGWTMDIGAFALSLWKRGVAYHLVPTTVVGQADACLGGKCGINFGGSKNQLGLFAPPESIRVWTGFLETLPEREQKAGLAELYKHGLIADKAYWERLTAIGWPIQDWQPLIAHSLELKRSIVLQDPEERKGLREILNFGHTAGHAIESQSLLTDKPLLHGEAIWYGMLVEASLSVQWGGLKETEYEAIITNIRTAEFLVNLPPLRVEALMQWAVQDKKNVGMKLRMSLLETIGTAQFGREVPASALEKALCRVLLL